MSKLIQVLHLMLSWKKSKKNIKSKICGLKEFSGRSLEEILMFISMQIWDRIEFAKMTKGFKIYETTITQELLYQLRSISLCSEYNIKLFEAVKENVNGNDIEFLIDFGFGFVLFPVQSKIIYESNFNYPKIDHNVNGVEQIDLLINYAKEHKGIPFYLLYNYHSDKELLKKIELTTGLNHMSFGVSFVNAFFIKDSYYQKRTNQSGKLTWKIPSFKELHPRHAKAFHEILGLEILIIDNQYLIEIPTGDGIRKFKLEKYSYEDITNDENWIDQSKRGINKSVSRYDDISVLSNNESKEFEPRFRIVISRKKKMGHKIFGPKH